MIYKDFEIKKEDNQYNIYNKFGDRSTKHSYKSAKEAKGVIDNVLLGELGSHRYMPCHFKHFIWNIMDKKTNSFLKDSNGNMIKFTNRSDCFSYCEKIQEKL